MTALDDDPGEAALEAAYEANAAIGEGTALLGRTIEAAAGPG